MAVWPISVCHCSESTDSLTVSTDSLVDSTGIVYWLSDRVYLVESTDFLVESTDSLTVSTDSLVDSTGRDYWLSDTDKEIFSQLHD